MSFFKKIFNLESGAPKEALPRTLPAYAREYKPDSNNWVMSMEYDTRGGASEAFGKAERLYAAAHRLGSGSAGYWQIHIYASRNTKTGNAEDVMLRAHLLEHTMEPAEVIRTLMKFEADQRKLGYEPVTNTYQTYRDFAARNGYHFDNNGKLIFVHANKPLLSETVVPADRLDALFRNRQKADVTSWESFYKTIVGPLDEMDGKDAGLLELQNDRAYAEFHKACLKMMGKLDDLQSFMANPRNSVASRGAAMAEASRYISINTRIFETREKATMAEYLTDVTLIVGMLRAANTALASEEYYVDGKINTNKLKLIQMMSQSLRGTVEKRLLLTEAEVSDLVDLAMKGPDPFAPQYPLQKIFAAYPVIDVKKAPETKQGGNMPPLGFDPSFGGINGPKPGY